MEILWKGTVNYVKLGEITVFFAVLKKKSFVFFQISECS